MSAEALARVLESADERSATWPGMAAAILADPAPLLAALAEAGVLREWTTDSPLGPQHRYTTDWTEVQP